VVDLPSFVHCLVLERPIPLLVDQIGPHYRKGFARIPELPVKVAVRPEMRLAVLRQNPVVVPRKQREHPGNFAVAERILQKMEFLDTD
jgi:hypothetical protein